MQAWKVQIGKPDPIRTQVPVPKVDSDGVLVKVLAMGVCHSDCTILSFEQPIMNMQPEFILGHEGAGEIVQLGSSVDKSRLAVGDKVALYILPGCGSPSCPECSRGLCHLCRAKGIGNYGLTTDGFFAEYVAVMSRAVVKLPLGMDVIQAAVSADAILTAFHAVKYTAGVDPSQTIAIFGLGGVGMNGLQTALHLGAKRILVVDKRRHVLDEAIKLGIPSGDTFCTSGTDSPTIEQTVAEKGIAIDTAIDFVGHEQTITSAQLSLRPGGVLCQVGLFSQQAPYMVMPIVLNALTIKGCYNGSLEALSECLQLMKEGVLKPNITTRSLKICLRF